MSVRRIMGTEVEYGISVPGQPDGQPDVACPGGQRLRRAAEADPRRPGPLGLRGGVAAARRPRLHLLRRGATTRRGAADEDLGLANVILTNGARLYVDHAHPEYSTPEVTNPLDIVLWDKAGERVMAEAARRAATHPGHPADPPLQEQHRQQGRLATARTRTT